MSNSVYEAVKSNDKRATLIAMRDKIAMTIDTCESGRDMASLTKRLSEVIGELETLPDPNAKKSSLARAQEKAKKRNG